MMRTINKVKTQTNHSKTTSVDPFSYSIYSNDDEHYDIYDGFFFSSLESEWHHMVNIE